MKADLAAKIAIVLLCTLCILQAIALRTPRAEAQTQAPPMSPSHDVACAADGQTICCGEVGASVRDGPAMRCVTGGNSAAYVVDFQNPFNAPLRRSAP